MDKITLEPFGVTGWLPSFKLHPSSSTMKDDNLFAETSMSFGDHLEELRKCFFASIYWIAIGTVVGFFLGKFVVEYITIPVEKSLDKYYMQQGVRQLESERKKLEEEGVHPSIFAGPFQRRLVPLEVYIYPGEWERVLERQKAVRKKSIDGSDEFFMPGEVDNLITRKKVWEKKQVEIFGGALDLSGGPVHYDVEPIRMMFFTKIENDARTRTRALGVYEVFWIWIQASIVVGLVFSSPFVAFHLWSFVAAGLYPHEKKYIYLFIPVSIVLFIGGAAFAFFIVFQFVLDFLFSFNSWMHIDPDPRISEWIKFALMMPVGFGASFQLPLVMFVLERVGIFTYKQYVSSWRISVLAIFILALMLTPGDPGSMLLMAIPLTILYFGGVFFCWAVPRKKGIFDVDEEDQLEDY